MNAGGVDKACKSNEATFEGECDYIKLTDVGRLVANELVTSWYVPRSRAQRVERSANSRWSRKGKGASHFESGLDPISLLAG